MATQFQVGQAVAEFRLLRRLDVWPFASFLACRADGRDDGVDPADAKPQVRLTPLPETLFNAEDAFASRLARVKAIQATTNAHIFSVVEIAEGWLLAEELDAAERPLFETSPTGREADDWRVAWRLCRDLAAQLEVCHEAKLVHGAISPAEVWTDSEQRVHLFGWWLMPSLKQHLEQQRPFGTAVENANEGWSRECYLAPEFGLHESPASDVYSIGRLLLGLLSGDNRHTLEYSSESGRYLADAEARPLVDFAERLTTPLRDLLRECLSRELDQRPANAGRLRAQLDKLAELPPNAWPTPLSVPHADGLAADSMPTTKPDPEGIATRRIPSPTSSDNSSSRTAREAMQVAAAAARNTSIEVRLWKRRHPLAYTICVLMLLPLIGVLAARLAAVARSPAFRGEDDAELTRTELYLASGNDGSWWADDAATYYLLPPVRTYAADRQCDLSSLTSIVLENGGDQAAGEFSLVTDLREYQACVDAFHPQATEGRFRLRGQLEQALPAKENASTSADMHLRGLILHRLANLKKVSFAGPFDSLPAAKTSEIDYQAEAAEAYATALAEYPWYKIGMRALCHTDYARLLQQSGQRRKAIAQLAAARRLIYTAHQVTLDESATHLDRRERRDQLARKLPEQVRGFMIGVLCQMVDAERKEGNWGHGEELLAEAHAIARVPDLAVLGDKVIDPQPATRGLSNAFTTGPNEVRLTQDARTIADRLTPLQCYVLERAAWFHMDRWRLEPARRNFALARDARQRLAETFEEEGDHHRELFNRQQVFHDWHGLAMIARYQGDTAFAARQYQHLVDELRDRLSEATAAERQAYEDRLTNSLERLADCWLFDQEQAEADGVSPAVRSLEEAIYETERQYQFRPTPADTLANLHFKLALAYSLSNDFITAADAFRMAEAYATRRGVDERRGEQAENNSGDGVQRQSKTAVADAQLAVEKRYTNQRQLTVRNLVEAVMQHAQDERSQWDLYQTIRREYLRLDRTEQISREELDLMLLAARQLDAENDATLDKRARLYADMNVKLARLPQADGTRKSILEYVRPSYQLAIAIHCQLGLGERICKELEKEMNDGLMFGG